MMFPLRNAVVTDCLLGQRRPRVACRQVKRKADFWCASLWQAYYRDESSEPSVSHLAAQVVSPRFGSMLASKAQSYDVVIIDGPPVMEIADAATLRKAAVGTIIVVQPGNVWSVNEQAAVKRSRAARANVLFTGVTQFDAAMGGRR